MRRLLHAHQYCTIRLSTERLEEKEKRCSEVEEGPLGIEII